jgi:hypothetical protein
MIGGKEHFQSPSFKYNSFAPKISLRKLSIGDAVRKVD